MTFRASLLIAFVALAAGGCRLLSAGTPAGADLAAAPAGDTAARILPATLTGGALATQVALSSTALVESCRFSQTEIAALRSEALAQLDFVAGQLSALGA